MIDLCLPIVTHPIVQVVQTRPQTIQGSTSNAEGRDDLVQIHPTSFLGFVPKVRVSSEKKQVPGENSVQGDKIGHFESHSSMDRFQNLFTHSKYGYGSKLSHQGTAGSLFVSIYQRNPFWGGPCFDPPPTAEHGESNHMPRFFGSDTGGGCCPSAAVRRPRAACSGFSRRR